MHFPLLLPWLLLAPALSYPARVSRIDAQRRELAVRLPAHRAAVLGSARTIAFRAITSELLPQWEGTAWNFNGTTERPREGTIACGYLVTTVLRDAGFNVARGPLARAPSEALVKAFAAPEEILRFRDVPPEDVVRRTRAASGDGLYLVGMDFHVGFLVLDGSRADLCHSSWVGTGGVVCEPAAASGAFRSHYDVVGPVLDDARVEGWLTGRAIP